MYIRLTLHHAPHSKWLTAKVWLTGDVLASKEVNNLQMACDFLAETVKTKQHEIFIELAKQPFCI